MKLTLATVILSCFLSFGPTSMAHAEVPCRPELVGPRASYAANLPNATGFAAAAFGPGAEFSAENTLMVRDIDNTLMAIRSSCAVPGDSTVPDRRQLHDDCWSLPK